MATVLTIVGICFIVILFAAALFKTSSNADKQAEIDFNNFVQNIEKYKSRDWD